MKNYIRTILWVTSLAFLVACGGDDDNQSPQKTELSEATSPECLTTEDCGLASACADYSCEEGSCVLILKALGTECRASAGDCDLAESCDGISSDCPADTFKAAMEVCRAAEGGCDTAETCPGTAADCPADVTMEAGMQCRASSGDCDVAEVCDGTGKTCPDDLVIEAGTVCREAIGDCDVAEV